MDARKGFAPPPVICGRRPWPRVDPAPVEPPSTDDWPNPVGCPDTPVELVKGSPPVKPPLRPPPVALPPKLLPLLKALPLVPRDDVEGSPVIAGVTGAEPGIEGKDSNNEAPNDDEGLNGLSPLKPVV